MTLRDTLRELVFCKLLVFLPILVTETCQHRTWVECRRLNNSQGKSDSNMIPITINQLRHKYGRELRTKARCMVKSDIIFRDGRCKCPFKGAVIGKANKSIEVN